MGGALIFCLVIAGCAVWGLKHNEKRTKEKQKQENEILENKISSASIMDIAALPGSVTAQLLKNENVYYFSYIAFKGGCSGSESLENHWIALTDKRILYKSKISENSNTKLIEKNGVIPFEKISFLEIASSEQKQGCGGDLHSYELRIGSSGGVTVIPIPTEEKGFEIRKFYMEVLEILKEKEKKNNENSQ